MGVVRILVFSYSSMNLLWSEFLLHVVDVCIALPSTLRTIQCRVEGLWRTLVADTNTQAHCTPAPTKLGERFSNFVLVLLFSMRELETLDAVIYVCYRFTEL